MIIDFENRVTLKKVEEMIASAVSFTTGVINLTNATDDEVKSAFSDPDRWLCSCTYSGSTYLEQRRRVNNSGDTYVYFYVPSAQADNDNYLIFDFEYWIKINPQTGSRTYASSLTSNYVPDIIYNLDRMNEAQIAKLYNRIYHITARNNNRFTVKWTYNHRKYVYIAGQVWNDHTYDYELCGTAIEIVNGEFVVYYDIIHMVDGYLIHNEYTSNITLTPVITQ